MLYGSIKKLLKSEYSELDDTVLVESSFKEITRDGKKILRLVQLGLTSKAFLIASEHDLTGRNTTTTDGIPLCRDSSIIEILSLYPLDSIKITVFKRSQKQSLKVWFANKNIRYFELRDVPNKKIFFKVWCLHIKELNSSPKKWPFVTSTHTKSKQNQQLRSQDCLETRYIKHSSRINRYKWADKYLYLGSQRETEDNVRPVPVPGLGRAEEIKLLYLKPRYFGCWEQSEHWVQCEDSSIEITQNE